MQEYIRMKVPLSRPDLAGSDKAAVLKVLNTPHLSLGPKIREFEDKVCGYIGARHAVAVNSGTAGLHLIVKALGIGKGDEVITTPFSFISSSNCILYEGARPVFADIDPLTLNIDPAKVAKAVTKRTKAILAVDTFGHPADWDALKAIARRNKLALIEDSAEALGSEYRGSKCGTFGDAAVFSFYPNKQITTGEGGMVVTGSKKIADICRSFANQGRKARGGKWLEHLRLGYNYRMSDINAALGIAQLSRIDAILKRRRQAAGMYNDKLKDASGIRIPYVAKGVKLAWFVYVVRLSGRFSGDDRNGVIKRMAAEGIQCSDYFRPIHLQPFYKKLFEYKAGSFPVCEEAAGRTIALPFHNNLRASDAGYVVESLKKDLKLNAA